LVLATGDEVGGSLHADFGESEVHCVDAQ
jgi:hypothetical protein